MSMRVAKPLLSHRNARSSNTTLPVAPGATGNVVFEDLVFLCESKGFATGIDIERLVAVRSILRSEMPGEPLYGGLARAGLPDRKSGVAA